MPHSFWIPFGDTLRSLQTLPSLDSRRGLAQISPVATVMIPLTPMRTHSRSPLGLDQGLDWSYLLLSSNSARCKWELVLLSTSSLPSPSHHYHYSLVLEPI